MYASATLTAVQPLKNILKNTKINTELAVKYLDYLISEYRQIELVLIGYNAGPSWVKRYNRENQALPTETLNYIDAVKKYYQEYDNKLSFYLPGSRTKIGG